MRRRAAVRVGRGPLECERLLLDDLAPLLAARGEPRAALVVVPSRSLVLHLQARLVESCGRPVVGVRCATLWSVARALAERAGAPLPASLDLFAVLAQRRARQEPALARTLDQLADGYSSLLGAVRDLLDAGIAGALVEGLEEALASGGPAVATREEVERARALLRVAASVHEVMASQAPRRSHVMAAAAEALRGGELPGPPDLAVHVYGFADATGVASDLLAALLDRGAGTAYLDRPLDPADPARLDASDLYGRRFRDRLELVAPRLGPSGEPPPTPRLRAFCALGAEAEVREAAQRVLALLEAGLRPERIGLVARSLEPYRSLLRDHLERLGIPFSALGARAAAGGAGRLAHALLDCLRLGPRAPIDRWLEVSRPGLAGVANHDLRTALFRRGSSRLREAAALGEGAEPADLVLPVLVELAAGDEGARPGPVRRWVPGSALRAAGERALSLCRRWEAWPPEALPPARHEAILGSLLDEDLGWAEHQRAAPLREAIAAFFRLAPAGFALTRDELLGLLADYLEGFDREPLGGAGGGVQVLDALEARGRTFEHLFLLGCNRGVFPRPVQEDTLLPDALRRVLAGGGAGPLPDLGEKRAGLDEERYLFAHLLAASPEVTISWLEVDDEHRAMAPSPLVERLRARRTQVGEGPTWAEPELVGDVLLRRAADSPLTAQEAAAWAGLGGERRALGELLPAALAEAGAPPAAPRLVAARLAVLEELSPRRRRAARLGPYFGFVGGRVEGDARSRHALWATHLERLARCPWQMLLTRVLALERPPDPLSALPGIGPRLVGGIVHETLRLLVAEAAPELPRTVPEAALSIGAPVPWPDERRLGALLRRAAEHMVAKDGIDIPGFAAAAAAACRPYLECAGQLDWGEGEGPRVLGAELAGVAEVADLTGARRPVRFRVDRLDRAAAGFRWSDYKTGRRPLATVKSEEAQRRHLLAAVGAGDRLQAALYLAAGEASRDESRYLFLHPALEPSAARVVRLAGDDEELAERFAQAAGTLFAAWDAGTFFPRLADPDGDHAVPEACKVCEVRDACLQHDSGSRRRLLDWIEERLAQEGGHEGSDLTVLCAWLLPSRERRAQ